MGYIIFQLHWYIPLFNPSGLKKVMLKIYQANKEAMSHLGPEL